MSRSARTLAAVAALLAALTMLLGCTRTVEGTAARAGSGGGPSNNDSERQYPNLLKECDVLTEDTRNSYLRAEPGEHVEEHARELQRAPHGHAGEQREPAVDRRQLRPQVLQPEAVEAEEEQQVAAEEGGEPAAPEPGPEQRAGVLTQASVLAAYAIERLRFHGSRDKRTFELVGVNSRLDELQAGPFTFSLVKADRDGDILLDGEVITDPSVDAVAARRRLGFVFQAQRDLAQHLLGGFRFNRVLGAIAAISLVDGEEIHAASAVMPVPSTISVPVDCSSPAFSAGPPPRPPGRGGRCTVVDRGCG